MDTPDLINKTFLAQNKTALSWRNSTTDQRIERLKKIKTWVLENEKKIQDALFEDFKKPAAETTLSEIYPLTSEINHVIKNLATWVKPKKVPSTLAMAGTKSKIYYEPKGVSLIISPWNYPFNLAIGPLISALAAGCTAIIKPSELTPHTSGLIKSMIAELFESSEVAVFTGDVEVSKNLLKFPFDHIFFTGSPTVGKIVMEAASKNLSSITLELGGKSPTIIHDSADLKDAAEKIIKGKFINCGQTCIAPDYVLVQNQVKEELMMEMKVAIQKMYDPEYKGIEHSKDLARIINQKNHIRLEQLIQDAIEKGAKFEFGGNITPETLYIEPTILSNLNENMDLMNEEIFGPILPILTYEDIQEAIDLINSKPKPLALYYFGKDDETTNKVISDTSSGNAVINDCVLHYLHKNLPFGGVNNSGIGKAHGHYGFLAFSNEKGVLRQRVGFNNSSMIKPPYGIKVNKIISSLIKWL
ncbi:aldehyde dehydrogenase family protein [Algoriphagus machipongonensis]|uniref:Aldehyde dehydrogenase n=1 Tax=Algoriphagus machipongonensis TaxID=388413 RepID=A3HTV5_9BACT|nr:aldehyde dehydrogenase family protein [Algoriphagus machipongonensis]EAZ81577.1 aldehyde dehydrogenase [Algoriphagus machipongonensis]